MTQTPERRMYLMWKARRKNSGDWYRRGYGASPLMQVARRFKVPVRLVCEAIEAQRGPDSTTEPVRLSRRALDVRRSC